MLVLQLWLGVDGHQVRLKLRQKEVKDEELHRSLLCNSFLRVKKGSERRASEHKRYAVSKQRTMASGLVAVVYFYRQAPRKRAGERPREEKKMEF